MKIVFGVLDNKHNFCKHNFKYYMNLIKSRSINFEENFRDRLWPGIWQTSPWHLDLRQVFRTPRLQTGDFRLRLGSFRKLKSSKRAKQSQKHDTYGLKKIYAVIQHVWSYAMNRVFAKAIIVLISYKSYLCTVS